ncbi:MAG: hypothetical protein JRF33_21990 [Deltaproteobacteria bacterium]|nr:hypothetical protein [Deltaproteobacteria bacterium]
MAQTASAHDNNYPFDYDPSLSEDPAGIAADLQDLHDALPGLPEGIVEIEMDAIAFDYFPEVLGLIQRALDSGPEIAAPVDRTPQLCAVHGAFSLPVFLIEPASSACQAAGEEVAVAVVGGFKTCQEVEFPEVYVLDHPPAVVDANFLGQSDLLSTLEGQIALIGEALSHLDYPVGLIPEDFLPTARCVIAKIRYETLRDNIDARLAAYQVARERLQSSASCFYPDGSASLQGSIDALSAELTVVGQELDQLLDDGLAQAAADRLEVENQGRLRNDLPHPSLTDHEREMLAFYLGAVYWRMRGGGLIRNPANGDVPDITYVINIFTGIARFAGGLEDADSVGPRYAIDETHGYAEWWDMGNEPGHDQYYDLLWMTDRGRRGVNLAKTFIGDLGYDIRDLVAGGLMMGPCYYYMWYELWARNDRYFQLGEDLVTPYYVFCEMPVSSGEVCYGGAMGLGLARTLLWGVPDTGCQPDCAGRECGSDGCGGSCGDCGGDESCVEGLCQGAELDGGQESDGGELPDAGASDAGVDAADAGVDASDAEVDGASPDAGADGQAEDGSADDGDGQTAGDQDPIEAGGCACGNQASTAGCLPLLMLLLLGGLTLAKRRGLSFSNWITRPRVDDS